LTKQNKVWIKTHCLRDLYKLNLNWWFDFRLGPILIHASKMPIRFKINRKWHKTLSYFTKVQSKSLTHSVEVWNRHDKSNICINLKQICRILYGVTCILRIPLCARSWVQKSTLCKGWFHQHIDVQLLYL